MNIQISAKVREHHYEDFSAIFPAEVEVAPNTSGNGLPTTTYTSVLRPGEFLQITVLRGKEVITDKEIMEGIRYEYQRAKGVAIDGKVDSVTARGNWPVLDDDTATTIAGMSIVGEHEGYKASHLTFHHQYPNEEAEVRSFAVYAGNAPVPDGESLQRRQAL